MVEGIEATYMDFTRKTAKYPKRREKEYLMIGVQEKNYKSYCFNSINYSVIFIYLLFVIFPIIWIVLLSLKTEVQAFANPPLFIFKPNLMNYYNLFV